MLSQIKIGLKLNCFIFFLTFCKVQSSIQTIDADEICLKTKDYSELEELYEHSFTCSGAKHGIQIINEIPFDLKELIIVNSTIVDEIFGFQIINGSKFEDLVSVKITNSFIGPAFLRWMLRVPNLENLNFIRSATNVIVNQDDRKLTTIDLELSPLKKLKKLQISGGNITNINVEGLNNPILDLSGNHFECSHDFTWLITLSEKTDKIALNDTICFVKKIEEKNVSFPILYTYSHQPFIDVMQYKREALINCPPKCQCMLIGMINKDRPQLNVECSGINMTKLPEVIPRGSTRCNFSHNLIEDLTPLYGNKFYENVASMSLSHNSISFLDPVRFPDFLRKRGDVGFWLDYNKMTKFPAAGVLKVFEEARKNKRYTPQFMLANNPWLCSCDYIAEFQKMVYQHMYDIYGARDIRCSDGDPDNPGVMVLGLDVADLCAREPLFNIVDIINIFLAILLLLLIADFTYNYRQYKKTQKLPWIVTKFKC